MNQWWRFCFLLIFLQYNKNVFAQIDDYNNVDGGYDDPLRRTLGLLGRIMNRMAQPQPPTDDQLHFTVKDPPEFRELSALIRQQKKIPSKTDRIINEELLQRLIPRIKGQTLPPRTPPTTTTKLPKTTITTTVATTTTTVPTTTTPSTTTTTEPPTTTSPPTIATTTTEAATTMASHKNDESSLIVRVKSIEEIQKSLEASAELNDEDSKNAKIVAEALRILLKEEGMNATKATERLREIAKEAIDRGLEKATTTASTTLSSSSSTVEPEIEDIEVSDTTEENIESTTMGVEEETEIVTEEEEEEGQEETTEETTEALEEAATVSASSPIVFKQEAVRIPEAEEEELPTKSQESVEVSFQETGTTTTTRSPLNGQTVYNLNANANSASDPAISNVFTPVNAIVDGIGPLILPLIGYSRQALQSYRAQGANTYVPSNEGKPVQLRTLSRGYGNTNQNPDLIYARGVPIRQQQQQSAFPPSLKTATNEELIAAFHRASQNNAAASPRVNQQQQQQLYSRYVPNQSSLNSYYSQATPQRNLDQLRNAFVQQPNIASYNSRQSQQEIVGSTLPVEPTYYGPQIDRHIGQNILSQGTRQHKPEPQKPALPIEANPDPAYAEGLKKVTAFVGDSGVMTGDTNANANLPTNLESNSEAGTAASPPQSEAASGNGFGGGRRPNASFEDVKKNTEDLPSYSSLFG